MSEHTRPSPSARDEGISRALAECQVPLIVWQTSTGTIRLVDEEFAALCGSSPDALVGRHVTRLVTPTPSVELAVQILDAGAIDVFQSVRALHRADASMLDVVIWTRGVSLGDERCAVSLVVPRDEVATRLPDPEAPWRALAATAVGIAGPDWRILTPSKELAELVGRAPEALVGTYLFDLVEPGERTGHLRGPRTTEARGDAPPARPGSIQVRAVVHCADGSTAEVCVLSASLVGDAAGRVQFALIGEVQVAARPEERVHELERRLRRIAAEVQAAEVLLGTGGFEEPAHAPVLRELSTRQWEILSRLVRGERVPQIAAALYISQSTVRNHLAAIFEKFGVHSQGELLALMRRAAGNA